METRFVTPFHHLLVNNLVANITNFTIWFALTFYVYLETKSVFATGMIAGVYLVLTAACGIWFGSLVDHHRKKLAMAGSSLASLLLYALALAVLLLAPKGAIADVGRPWLWALIGLSMLGVIAGNIRTIALPTLVTLLIPEDRRDKANGLVGMVSGVGFLTTSVISGFLVAWGGMLAALTFALGFTVAALVHLLTVPVDEPRVEAEHGAPVAPRRIDLAGTIKVVAAVPGLFALILFATFNNFLGGIFMALLDAYGLSMVSVQAWGLLFGFLSVAFIISGLAISKTGLGKNPLRTLLLVNLISWAVCCVFPLKSSIVMLAMGCFVWMLLGPYAEAAEQTTLQKVVPFERQGRVFGFAQSVEQAASPLTAFLIGPLTQFIVIPFMTHGAGAAAIGDWFGRGPDRGMALVFTLAGVVGLIVTLLAFGSKAYRQLSAAYAQGEPAPAA
ncbi:MFS transporter [Caulobacter vibrioides]|uniref:Multidrug resistance protein n=2 Tax=Caulobacter vibrioides TaxID=155892 RepID=Q9AB53_CAUVC|nr:MFS transporter [Caulobacter vibrioides]YP_002515760.1 multidrug resistance protein [Caulobacter vibrioides NA1000]AAK22368.1 multidrug resistance protein [Caulobacter vibrioides CB15]ACL93852.1 multidrug resistance protein [Caulobacter vibrioides NA1000]ATC27211.1 multidrug resistance protein [Caulobacter vibrioides]QXZ52474.1 MFS transporter [Caulobacter vibrioides]